MLHSKKKGYGSLRECQCFLEMFPIDLACSPPHHEAKFLFRVAWNSGPYFLACVQYYITQTSHIKNGIRTLKNQKTPLCPIFFHKCEWFLPPKWKRPYSPVPATPSVCSYCGRIPGKKFKGARCEIRSERCGQDFHVKLPGAGLDGKCAVVRGERIFEGKMSRGGSTKKL